MSEVSKPRLEFDKSVQDFISSFGDGKRSHLPAGWIDGRREGVDLTDGVPGQVKSLHTLKGSVLTYLGARLLDD